MVIMWLLVLFLLVKWWRMGAAVRFAMLETVVLQHLQLGLL